MVGMLSLKGSVWEQKQVNAGKDKSDVGVIQHSLMKARIYTTNVISSGIYMPKMFLACICYTLKTPWVGWGVTCHK